MARLVAAFASSHSLMLAATTQDWIGGFRQTDRGMPLFDKDGTAREYDELLKAAPPDAENMVTPDKMSDAYERTFKAVAELKRQIDVTKLDALVIIGDDQHELFQDSMMPALGIYYGRTIRNAARGPAASAMTAVARRKRPTQAYDNSAPGSAEFATEVDGAPATSAATQAGGWATWDERSCARTSGSCDFSIKSDGPNGSAP